MAPLQKHAIYVSFSRHFNRFEQETGQLYQPQDMGRPLGVPYHFQTESASVCGDPLKLLKQRRKGSFDFLLL